MTMYNLESSALSTKSDETQCKENEEAKRNNGDNTTQKHHALPLSAIRHRPYSFSIALISHMPLLYQLMK